MTTLRQENFRRRKEKILAMAEILLLENHNEITLSELAAELDIAKGTIYKYFKSKNQLYLELIILNEQRLLEISKNIVTILKLMYRNTCCITCSIPIARFYCIPLKSD